MTRYLGIDPGPTESGWALIDVSTSPAGVPVIEVDSAGKDANDYLRDKVSDHCTHGEIQAVVIETIQSYGGMVGRSVFETCIEIGRMADRAELLGVPVILIPRPEYARWMADGARKVNDSVLRQALLLRYGGDRKGEPLHMLKGASDKRSAFAVAAYAIETGRVA